MADEFVVAAGDGKVGYVKRYLDNEDNDPNVESYGVTALQVASGTNKAEVVGVLLGCDRTDINATSSDDGWTALHWAAERDSVECARQLLEGKADVSIKDISGETALDVAKASGKEGVAALIEQHLAAASGGGQKVCLRVCVSVCVGGSACLCLCDAACCCCFVFS
eukprot:COSAG02_NODE_10490_length_1930_cov_20.335882_1_plen_165_part_01